MRAFVDQIDSGMVTLLLGDDESVTLTIPAQWIPFRVREGDVLRLDLSFDEAATREAKARIDALLDELGDAP